MLIKIKRGDTTLQFDSHDVAIAILLTPKDREAIDKMPTNEQLILTGPFSLMKDKAAETWQWAMTGWKGAQYVSKDEITQLRKF
jgi:hypothetical protein